MPPVNDQRSTINSVNLQAVLDAAATAKAAILNGQQQYSTPVSWATFLGGLLPSQNPAVAFDPQCAGGNLLRYGLGWRPDRYGFEIDARYAETSDDVTRVIANCVKCWEILDDLFPDLRFDCQVANPPFGIRWKTLAGAADSTLHTWAKITERAAPSGFGYFIANRNTLAAHRLHEHPWVYLYQTFPAGFFPKTAVEVGLMHWHNCPDRFRPDQADRLVVNHQTLDVSEHGAALDRVRQFYADYDEAPEADAQRQAVREAFDALQQIVEEERRKLPPWNLWLNEDGRLKLHLSTRFQIKRKLSPDEVVRLQRVDDCHPLTLTTEAETRKLLRSLVASGAYTIEPKAEAAIQAALAEVQTLAVPLMPVTDFERVAYTDELETLTVRQDFDPLSHLMGESKGEGSTLAFEPGRSYPLRTATYTFKQRFSRTRIHFDEETSQTTTVDHDCELTGQDRYVALVDDNGVEHRFMDHPRNVGAGLACQGRIREHPEALLWRIFEQPPVFTIADTRPDLVETNRQRLLSFQTVWPGLSAGA
jgi:hypothetical protein